MGRKYSYGETLDGVRRVACGLKALGYGRGDRIGLFLPNVPHYVAAYYGILKLGATVVNFSPLYSVEELAAMKKQGKLVLREQEHVFDQAMHRVMGRLQSDVVA